MRDGAYQPGGTCHKDGGGWSEDGRRLRLVPDFYYGCGLCVQACPNFAVRMGERVAVD